jgi:plasmid maintenance system killer protein
MLRNWSKSGAKKSILLVARRYQPRALVTTEHDKQIQSPLAGQADQQVQALEAAKHEQVRQNPQRRRNKNSKPK